jgi:CheY-like chemotaxis protein
MLDDLERMFRTRTDEKGVTFEGSRSADVPRYVVTDERKLRQVLVNVLGNAVKFTRQGGVVVRLGTSHASGAAPSLVVEVEDTGPGISDVDIRRLFKPFEQTRVGIEAEGGTGLGLALSREFARLLGGDITVTSRVGEGSVFRLETPLDVASVPSEPRPSQKGRVIGLIGDGPPPRILVVDDHDDSRTWILALLQEVGFAARGTDSAEEMLALVETWGPDVVLVDRHLARMGGLAAIRAIRALRAGEAVAIVALSASAFDDRGEALVALGANGWLGKPCREDQLLDEIARHSGVRYEHAALSTRVASVAPVSDSAERLAPEFAKNLRDAAHVADYDGLEELIAAMPPERAGLAEELRVLLARFAYDDIERLAYSRSAG